MSYILRVNPTACRISKWTGESACQLLGELGGLACKPSLQQAVDMGVPGAAIALERIVTREKNAAAHVAVSSASSDTPFDLAQNPRAHTEDIAIVLPRDNTEQEVKLQVALRMYETEILERELANDFFVNQGNDRPAAVHGNANGVASHFFYIQRNMLLDRLQRLPEAIPRWPAVAKAHSLRPQALQYCEERHTIEATPQLHRKPQRPSQSIGL